MTARSIAQPAHCCALPADRRPPLRRRPGGERAQRGSTRRPLSLPAALAVAALAVTVWLYLEAPRTLPAADTAAPGGAPGAGHERDLHRLHHEPSDAYCALPPPLVCAHGGDGSGGAPPKTLEAFQAALDAGVPGVEVDVAATSDGRLVVLHPRDLAQLLSPGGGPAQHSGGGGGGSAAKGEAAAVAEAAATAAGVAAECGARDGAGGGSCHAASPQRPQQRPPQHPQQQSPLQVGDFSWAQLAALRWPGGQRVAAAEDVLRLVVPATEHITLDVKTHGAPVRLCPHHRLLCRLVAWLPAQLGVAHEAARTRAWVAWGHASQRSPARSQLLQQPGLHLWHTLPPHLPPTGMQGSRREQQEVEALASAVLRLVAATACQQCLVWAKSDALVRAARLGWWSKGPPHSKLARP